MQAIITFHVCFLPGCCFGYAFCAILHNRRITRRNRHMSNHNWQKTGIFDLHKTNRNNHEI